MTVWDTLRQVGRSWESLTVSAGDSPFGALGNIGCEIDEPDCEVAAFLESLSIMYQEPGEFPKNGSTLGQYNLQHRSSRFQNGWFLFGSSRGSGYVCGGFPKIGGPVLGVPRMRIVIYWGLSKSP